MLWRCPLGGVRCLDPIIVRDLPVGRLDPAKMCVWAAPRLSGGAVAAVEGSCAALTIVVFRRPRQGQGRVEERRESTHGSEPRA